jgi:hypothetical protein
MPRPKPAGLAKAGRWETPGGFSTEYRPKTVLIAALTPYVQSEASMERVLLIQGGKAAGTQAAYNATLRKIDTFLKTREATLPDLTKHLIMDYLISLEHLRASFSFVNAIKGAVTFLCHALNLNLAEIWDSQVNVLYAALSKRAAMERAPPKKAPLLPTDALADAIRQVILPHLGDIEQVQRFFTFLV